MTRPEAMRFARDMYDDGAGWSVTEVQRHLNERGVSCIWETVKGWVDPEWRERRLVAQRDMKRRHWRRRHGATAFRVLDDDARARTRERLRAEAGLTDEQAERVLDVTGIQQREAGSVLASPFDRMRELRDEARLSYTSIASLMRLDHGQAYSPDQIRYALKAGYLPDVKPGRAAA